MRVWVSFLLGDFDQGADLLGAGRYVTGEPPQWGPNGKKRYWNQSPRKLAPALPSRKPRGEKHDDMHIERAMDGPDLALHKIIKSRLSQIMSMEAS